MRAVFYRFLYSKLILSVSWQIFLVFYLWYVVVVYNSVFLAGLIATTYLVTDLALAYPIGHLIDRANSTVVNFVASVILAAGFTIPFLGFGLPGIYASVAVCTVGLTSKGDSFSAFIKRGLPAEDYVKATSYNQGSSGVSSLVGVLLGGAVIVLFDRYLLAVLLSLSLTSVVLSIPIGENAVEHTGFAKETGQVIRFFRKITGFLIFGFVINGLFISLEVYASGIFHIVLDAGPIYYTAFSAAVPLGMIIGSLISNMNLTQLRKNSTIAAFLAGYAPLLIIIGLSGTALIDVVSAFGIGLLLPLINVPLTAKIIRVIPHEIYGKTMALMRVFIAGSTPLMAAVFSILAAFFPINLVLLSAGIIMLPFSIFALHVVRQLMGMDDAQKPEGIPS
ncbi:MAG: MFS transporter [Candidatus Thermoplasmatota archaeon]|jgi:hypothetical protein|nr:MFS transporter [Candidatus Thermoplasmatota archaeon]MCL5800339.1 MFS transporter [Candidatus Thermoplasmatota archaeon]